MFPFNEKLQVEPAKFIADKYIGIQSLDQVRQFGSDAAQSTANSLVTYAYGTKFSKNFPMLLQTQGMGKKRAVRSVNGVHYNHLFGKAKKTSVISKTIHQPGEKIGNKYSPIFLVFEDNWFMKGQTLYTGGFNGYQVRVYDNPVREASGSFKYECRMMTEGSLPYEYTTTGTAWSGGAVKVSLEHSRGTESRGQTPFRVQNQIGALRQSINVAGNIENKVMGFKIQVDNKVIDTYVSWERYLTELTFNEAKELDLVMSKYNKDASGMIQLLDIDSGKPIPSGMGIHDQIPASNELSYTRMTEKRFSNFIDDMLAISGQTGERGNEYIDIYGGEGLMTEFDEAMKRHVGMLTLTTDNDMFIRKDGDGLQAGYYFTSYKHRSGKIFRFTVHPMFDHGALAASAPRHPLNPARPITSYCGFILNFGNITVDSSVDKGGQAANIEYLYEEGREYIEGIVPGMAQINGKQGGMIATDVDASSLHMMCTQGVHCYNPMSLGKIMCYIS